MKHKVSELEGALLDAAVALALGWTVEGVWCEDPARPHDPIKLGEPAYWAEAEHFAPSQRWQDGGPIIERERIELVCNDGLADFDQTKELWSASYDAMGVGQYFNGPTPLVAAMRAYVDSKFGEEVELP